MNKLQIIGQYEHGKRTGLWFFTPTDTVLYFGHYENGLKQGKWIYYYNNHLLCELHYKNDTLHGPLKTYHQGLQPNVKATYDKGGLIGSYLRFDETGDTVENRFYDTMTFVKQDSNFYFDRSGELLSKDRIIAPVFPHSRGRSLQYYIISVAGFPNFAREHSWCGSVFSFFNITTTGEFKLRKLHLLTGLVDNESNKAIVETCIKDTHLTVHKTMPLFQPGFIDGEPINAAQAIRQRYQTD